MFRVALYSDLNVSYVGADSLRAAARIANIWGEAWIEVFCPEHGYTPIDYPNCKCCRCAEGA